MAGFALLTVAVAWHVLQADERARARAREELFARRAAAKAATSERPA